MRTVSLVAAACVGGIVLAELFLKLYFFGLHASPREIVIPSENRTWSTNSSPVPGPPSPT